MAWIGNSLFSLVLNLLVGFTCNFPERPETVQRDLRELGPTIGFAPPRIWENMLSAVRVRAADSTPLKRKMFDFFQRLAERAELRKADGRPVPTADAAAAWRSARSWFTGPLRDQLGLRRARAGSIPAARRSAPTPFDFSARSASI